MSKLKFEDPVLAVLRHYRIPVTRQNYLDLAYFGQPPKRLSAEEEAAPALIDWDPIDWQMRRGQEMIRAWLKPQTGRVQ
jgi:hypothetical protein